MTNLAIRVEDLGKLYHIGAAHTRFRYKTLRESLLQAVNVPLRRFRNLKPILNSSNTFWALRDVSFQVNRGEVVGIIGRNGAGKSTLLKILSHITEPTKGRVELYGRVGSLLEVGTGFHPELTGRENIYLNGSILGMKRAEINHKFDEIVAFAGVEKFLDTPVKRYSSGMYVRLAFAVAAHLQPEILLVDEVLAVGDIDFQKKCLNKMGEIAHEGRTILFVSHNMGAIESLCKQGILLEDGSIKESGDVHAVVASYTGMNLVEQKEPFKNCMRSGNGAIKVVGFHLEDPDENLIPYAVAGSPVVFAIEFETTGEKYSNVSVGFSVHRNNGGNLFLYYSHQSNVLFSDLAKNGEFRCLIPECPLAPGNFLVGFRIIANGITADWPKVYIPISVEIGDFYGIGSFDATSMSWGSILVRGEWSMQSR